MLKKYLPTDRSVALLMAGLHFFCFFLTVALHETAHAIATVVSGHSALLFWDHVSTGDERSVAAAVFAKMAGPVFSTLQGLGCALLVPRLKRPFARIACICLAFAGLCNGAGYLFTTAFAPAGDMGASVRMLGVPMIGQWLLTALGYLAIRTLVAPLARPLSDLIPRDGFEAKAMYAHANIVAPSIFCTLLVVLACLPPVAWIALIYAACSALPWFDLTRCMRRLHGHPHNGKTPSIGSLAEEGKHALVVWVVALVFVVLWRFLLRDGLSLGPL